MFSPINHRLLNAYFAVSFICTQITPILKQKKNQIISFLIATGYISILSAPNLAKVQQQLSSPCTIPARIPQGPILADITKPTSSPNSIKILKFADDHTLHYHAGHNGRTNLSEFIFRRTLLSLQQVEISLKSSEVTNDCLSRE